MFQRTKICKAALAAIGGVVVLGASPAAYAVDRVEITGSAIKRVDAEGALPVTVIRREEIERSGATSVTDLIQRLPAMQGATTEAASVGGGGGGFSGASIHNIGETRTLVLLNGRRLAQFGGQTLTGFGSAIDLNTLPLSSIERIEVLTDGASALYGSDAVAGVVNFITRRNAQEGDLTVGFSNPTGAGADEQRLTFSKGFGDLDKDGYNVFFALSAEKRDPLNAVDRDFSKTGKIPFTHKGQRYQAFLGSLGAIPANVADEQGVTVSPYYLANGFCPAGTVEAPDAATGKMACQFDFVAQLEIFPQRERQNLMTSVDIKLGENHTLYGDVLLSKTDSTGIIAPVPGNIVIPAGSPFYNQYITPVQGLGGSTFATTGNLRARYRVADLGKRADGNKSEFTSLVLGLRGTLFGDFDYETGLTYSKSDFKNSISGYPGARALNGLLTSGLLNPFVLTGQNTQAALDAVRAVTYDGYWDGGTSELTSFDLRFSKPLMNLGGGSMAVASGFNFYNEKFQGKPSLFAQGKLADPVAGVLCDADGDGTDELPCDQRFGDAAAIVPYSADRNVWGAFVELNAPITKALEVSAAVRFDDYSDFGNTTNGKLTAKFRATDSLLLRSSIGTGFKAPTVPQLKAAQQSYGVTSSPYTCTPELLAIATSLNAQCQPGALQYDVVAGGNALLKPEKSRQFSLGMVFEPVAGMSVGADFWWVGIKDAFGQITEDEAFANPTAYPGSWTTATDIGTGDTYLAYNQSNLNLGKAYYSGIDLSATLRNNTPIGRMATAFSATYMLRENIQLSPGGEYFDPIGVHEPSLGYVTFKWRGRIATSLQAGAWNHTLGMNFQSAYKDEVASVQVLGPNGLPTGAREDIQLKIDSFFTFDWQTQYQVTKNFEITGGILNVFNELPPLTLNQGGAGKGQMFGYDDRYFDARGRTFYVNGRFSF